MYTQSNRGSHYKAASGQATSQTEDQDKNIDTLFSPWTVFMAEWTTLPHLFNIRRDATADIPASTNIQEQEATC